MITIIRYGKCGTRRAVFEFEQETKELSRFAWEQFYFGTLWLSRFIWRKGIDSESDKPTIPDSVLQELNTL